MPENCTVYQQGFLLHMSGLCDIVKNCTYVGLADETYALLQHNIHLYLMNVVNVRYIFHGLIVFLFD